MSKQIKNLCSRCDFETNHKILFEHTFRSDNEDYDYVMEYKVVECLGCESISFRRDFIDIESSYPNDQGEWIPEVSVSNYPVIPKLKNALEDIYILPDKIRTVYQEAIKAYNANCFILTGVAFRAVIEAICIEKEIKGRNLEKKINALVRNKLITEKESLRLHSIRFIGNDSVHEMKVPSEKSLLLVFNIINHLLNNLYLIDFNSKQHLETVIDQYEEFTELIKNQIKKFNKGDEIPLAKILEKKVRRLNGKLNDFEDELIIKINSGEFDLLDIGKVDVYGNTTNQIQHFVVK